MKTILGSSQPPEYRSARFAANGFWPADNQLYRTDRKAYFRLLDRVVRAAERAGIGLVPSLFWNPATVPDIVGEPFSAWGDRDSRTRRFMRRYTREVVKRYRGSPAIWIWEFGNEYNDYIDLPDQPRFRPSVAPQLGTPPSRSAKDRLDMPGLLTAYEEFARLVRHLDPTRLISGGNDITRENAALLRAGVTEGIDTRSEWIGMLLRQNTSFPVLSVHTYLNRRRDFFKDAPIGIPGMFDLLERISVASEKPVFVGEFGPSADDRDRGREQFETLLAAIEKSDVALSALWNFGPRSFGGKINWNVTFENENAWMLEALSTANRALRGAAFQAAITAFEPACPHSPSRHLNRRAARGALP